MRTHYDDLGLEPTATPTQVRVAYCSRIWPAWARGDRERQGALRVARAVLCDPEARAAYDASVGLAPRRLTAVSEGAPAMATSAAAPAAAPASAPASVPAPAPGATAPPPTISLPAPQGPPPSQESRWEPDPPGRRRVRAGVVALAVAVAVVAALVAGALLLG